MIKSRLFRELLVVLLLVGGLVAGSYVWHSYTYPFGMSHCCDKQLHLMLLNYADRHGGDFPAGEATPEASLSLICADSDGDCAYLLSGKTGSEETTQAILDQGKLLDPNTCGWNYVEGLRPDDDRRLALFWDKQGLGHNGERLQGGGHIVMFVDGFTEHITAAEWDRFLTAQKKMLALRENGELTETTGGWQRPSWSQ